MRKRIAWAVLWLAGAALAAAGAAVVISLLGTDLFGGSSRPLTQAEVAQRLAANRSAASPTGSATTQPPGHHSSSPPASAARRTTFPTAAGTVSASCSGGLATLSSWAITTPGYQDDGYLQGPARSVWIRFKSSGAEQTVTVTCPGGVPHHVISNDNAADDHGGRRGGDHGGGHDDGGSSGGSGGSGRSPGGKGGG